MTSTIDGRAIEEAAALADLTTPHAVQHYLYAPTKEIAAAIADELARRGFEVEQGLSAGSVKWLVLAGHVVVLSEELIVSLRRLMETLAADVGGEYDGWEAEIPRH
ncbi:ribonuclease E inhibitor RraB [Bradyrhizobium sp. LHD-71]|uniref:ribonuclease E inhibitor RraB n=1 Tax=Bradyrhizobium sp. LHD-71 TaxID=3072141 RepID=UPI00280EA5B7|nr:ribonuclease E inhibitor RraB [Bradyrhizobium sp. LHD-71]MDQ8726184.1 ribonuclease E inhibitor RraB [Bradyrhizobium sp. LHD-71]